MDFTAGIFEKIKKNNNCGRWSEDIDVTLRDSISSNELGFEILSINVEVLEFL